MKEPPTVLLENCKQYEVSTPRITERDTATEFDMPLSQLRYISG